MTNGFMFPTHPSGSYAGVAGQPIGRQSPGSLPIPGSNAARYPSPTLASSIAVAAASPAATPPCSLAPSGIPWSVVAYRASSAATRSGATILTSTWCAAVATAASCEANGCAPTSSTSTRYGWCVRVMALTASYTAPCTIAMPRACPWAVGRMRTASAWAVAFQSPMTSARATAGAARTTTKVAQASSPRPM